MKIYIFICLLIHLSYYKNPKLMKIFHYLVYYFVKNVYFQRLENTYKFLTNCLNCLKNVIQ